MIGVMFVGMLGVNATTVITGTTAMAQGIIKSQFGITDYQELLNNNFIAAKDITFSGWDYFKSDVYECALRHGIIPQNIICKLPQLKEMKTYKGIHTPMDIPIENKFDFYLAPNTVDESINILCSDIKNFKEENQLENVIIFYMGSPGKVVKRDLLTVTREQFLQLSICELPSSVLYAVAALESKCSFVDFTPSETLEFSVVHELAKKNHVQISGRDGSTGQTMLKLTIAEMLKIRNLRLKAWYSTNIIGNHDGYILSMPDHCVTKIQDKTDGIKYLLGYDDFEHKVTIDYFKYKGDSKESWDSVFFNGWMNTPMSLKLNWQGEDAILAAPIILDIIRLIELGIRHGLYGFQKQLGLFYKHPFLCEDMSLSQLYELLIRFYSTLSTSDTFA